MKTSDDLLQLIQSLGKNEKRYVRLFLANRMGKDASSCIRLFDIASRMPTADAGALRISVGNESFAAHLHVTRHDLYRMILKALRDYDAGQSQRSKVRDLIEGAHVLLSRGLVEQTGKMVARAKKIAQQHDLFAEQIELRALQQSADSWLELTRTPETFASERADIETISERLRNAWDLDLLCSSITHRLLSGGKPRNQAELEDFDAIMRNPLLASESNALSTIALWYYLDCYRIYYIAIRDFERGYQNSLRLLELMESGSVREYVDDENRATILKHHVTTCSILKRTGEAHETQKKLMDVKGRSAAVQARIEMMQAQNDFAIHFTSRNFAAAAVDGERLEDLIALQGDNAELQVRIVIPFYLAYVQLMLGKPAVAMRKLLPVLSITQELRPDILMWARLLQLMIHYDQGNIELIPYLWRSAYRALRNRNALHPFEKIVLDFLRRLVGIHLDRDLRSAFRDLAGKLAALDADPYESEAARLFELGPWLDMKLNQEGALLRQPARLITPAAQGARNPAAGAP